MKSGQHQLHQQSRHPSQASEIYIPREIAPHPSPFNLHQGNPEYSIPQIQQSLQPSGPLHPSHTYIRGRCSNEAHSSLCCLSLPSASGSPLKAGRTCDQCRVTGVVSPSICDAVYVQRAAGSARGLERPRCSLGQWPFCGTTEYLAPRAPPPSQLQYHGRGPSASLYSRRLIRFLRESCQALSIATPRRRCSSPMVAADPGSASRPCSYNLHHSQRRTDLLRRYPQRHCLPQNLRSSPSYLVWCGVHYLFSTVRFIHVYFTYCWNL